VLVPLVLAILAMAVYPQVALKKSSQAVTSSAQVVASR
jgi:NADH:ubiquinone oxidoreductase subunit 4 (subunit M)